jgi:hypothetical protein
MQVCRVCLLVLVSCCILCLVTCCCTGAEAGWVSNPRVVCSRGGQWGSTWCQQARGQLLGGVCGVWQDCRSAGSAVCDAQDGCAARQGVEQSGATFVGYVSCRMIGEVWRVQDEVQLQLQLSFGKLRLLTESAHLSAAATIWVPLVDPSCQGMSAMAGLDSSCYCCCNQRQYIGPK